MHRLRRYDVFRFAQNDVARFTRNDAMFAIMCRQAHIIRRSRHHRRSQHHLPQANIIQKTHLCHKTKVRFLLVGDGGFGPAKSVTTDLQSAPFGRSGIPPRYGAGDRSRTNNLLITNQLLCH